MTKVPDARDVPLASTAEIAWLAKRYSREVPTKTSERAVDSLYRRGLISMVWRPPNYWEADTVDQIDRRRTPVFCTYCTPLGRRVVDAHKRPRQALAQAGGWSLSAAPWGDGRRRPTPTQSPAQLALLGRPHNQRRSA